MRNHILVTLVAVWIAAGVAGAEQIDIGLFGTLEYDNNVFNRQDDLVNDVVFRTGLDAGLRRTRRDVTYELRYSPRFEQFVDNSAISDWDHNGLATLGWRVGPRTTLAFRDHFFLTNSLNRAAVLDEGPELDTGPSSDLEVDRQQIIQNASSLSVNHLLTPRLEGTGRLDYSIFRSDQEGSFDSQTTSGIGQLLYALNANNRVGGGTGVTLQSFDDTPTQDGSDTLFYRVFGSWVHAFDPSMTLRVNAGPTWIDADQSGRLRQSALVVRFPFRDTEGGGLRLIDASTCPTDDGVPVLAPECGLFSTQISGADAFVIRRTGTIVFRDDEGAEFGQRMTLFAEIEFVKRWDKWRTVLRYLRTDSTSSGVGQSTVLDVLTAQLIWTPDRYWSLFLVGQYSNRQSATEQVANAVGLANTPLTLLDGTIVPAAVSTSLRSAASDNFIDVQQLRFELRAERRVWERGTLFARALYLQQESGGTQQVSSFDNFRVLFGFRWRFDSIHI